MSEFDHVHLFYPNSFDRTYYFAHELIHHAKVEKTSLKNTHNIYTSHPNIINELSGNICLGFMYNKVGDNVFPFFQNPCDFNALTRRPVLRQETQSEVAEDYDDDDMIDDFSDEEVIAYHYFNYAFYVFLDKLRENESISSITIDLLTCEVNDSDVIQCIRDAEIKYNITIRYSIDKTGNPSLGTAQVNWILESHNVNIRDLYFHNSVSTWGGYLDSTTTLLDGLTLDTDYSITNPNSKGGKTYTLLRNIVLDHNDPDSYLALNKFDIFDGSGYVINLNNTATSSQRDCGLFKVNNTGGTSINDAVHIKNIGVKNGAISETYEGLIVKPNAYYLKIENCFAQDCLINSPQGSAICGYNLGNASDGKIHVNKCYTNNCILVIAPSVFTDSTTSNYESELNGINTGGHTFSGNRKLGGIASRVAGSSPNSTLIENCYNKNIKIQSKESGGIVGNFHNISGVAKENIVVRNCFSIGGELGYFFQYAANNIRSQGIGGIVGQGLRGYVYNCFSNDTIVSTSTANGYICGSSSQPGSLIENCYSIGTMAAANTGGISGSNNKTDISNCFSAGNLSNSNCGGIVGYGNGNNNVQNVITNCYSTGDIAGHGSGGITGPRCSSVILRNCFSVGNIQSNSGGGLFGKQTASTFNASDSQNLSLYIRLYNCYALGNIQSSNASGIFGESNAKRHKFTSNHTIEMYNCYYGGKFDNGSSINKYNGAFCSRDTFALRAYNCYSTDNQLPLIGEILEGVIDNANTKKEKAQIEFYNCQSGSGKFLFDTNAHDISGLIINMPDGITNYNIAHGSTTIPTGLYSTQLLKSQDNTQYTPIYENDPNYNASSSPFQRSPWQLNTYNTWDDKPTLLWQHERADYVENLVSRDNPITNNSGNAHILIDLGHVYDTSRIHNLSLYNIASQSLKNIESVQLLNVRHNVQMQYEHGNTYNGILDHNNNVVGALRYYGPAKLSYSGLVPYVSQSNASQNALIQYETNSSSEYQNLIKLDLAQPENLGKFKYILVRVDGVNTSPNLREVQCWVDDVNVCITGNSLSSSAVTTAKYIDLRTNQTDYDQSHGGHLTGNANFGHPSLALDEVFSTHAHPLTSNTHGSLLIDLDEEYDLKDLQCLVIYNRKNGSNRYNSVDSIELLNSNYDSISYHLHRSDDKDLYDENSNYKDVYLYRGYSYNTIESSKITDADSTTQIRDDPDEYLNGSTDGNIAFNLVSPTLEYDSGTKINTRSQLSTTGNSSAKPMRIISIQHSIKTSLVAEFIAQETYVSGAKWTPSYHAPWIFNGTSGNSNENALVNDGKSSDMNNNELYGELFEASSANLVYDSTEAGIEIPCNPSSASNQQIRINMSNVRADVPYISWEFWVKINDFDLALSPTIIANVPGYGNNRRGYIHRADSGYIGVIGKSSTTPSYKRKIDKYQLYHIVYTHDNSKGSDVFVNGKKYNNASNNRNNSENVGTSGPAQGVCVALFVDTASNSNTFREGYIYSFRCYNKILNQREINHLYNSKYKNTSIV